EFRRVLFRSTSSSRWSAARALSRLWKTGIPGMSPSAVREITRPITNTGDVCSPASRLYSSQTEPNGAHSEQREDADAGFDSHQRASGPVLAGMAGGTTDRA